MPSPEPAILASFNSGCDRIIVRQREGSNGERIEVIDQGYGGASKNVVGLEPRSARRLAAVLNGLADAMDPERTEMAGWEIQV